MVRLRCPVRLARLLQSGFLRRVTTLGGGTAIAQGTLLLLTPLLTRIYGPEEFGIFAIFAALVALLGGALFLRLEITLPVCRERELATAIAAIATVGLGMLLLITLASFAIRQTLPLDPALETLLAILPAALLLLGLPRIFLYLAIRRDRFRSYALIQATQTVGQGCGQLLLGLLTGGSWMGLVWGYAGGVLPAALLGCRLQPLPRWWQALRRRRIHAYLRRYRRYPLYLAPGQMLYSATQFLPPLLIALLFDPRTAGLYALAQRLLGLPIQLVGQAVSQVLLGDLARSRDFPWGPRIDRLLMGLAGGMGVFVMILLLLGTAGWTFVLGEDWSAFFDVLLRLAPLFAVRFLLDATVNVLVVGEAQSRILMSAAAQLLVVGLAYGGGRAMAIAPLTAIALHSSGVVLVMLLQLVAVRRVALSLGRERPPSRSS